MVNAPRKGPRRFASGGGGGDVCLITGFLRWEAQREVVDCWWFGLEQWKEVLLCVAGAFWPFEGFFVCFILRAVNTQLYVVIKFRIVCGIWRVRPVLLDLQFNVKGKKATIVSRVIASAGCALNAQTKQTCCDFHRSKLQTIGKTWKSNPKTAFTPSPEMHHSCHNKSPRLKEGGKIELGPDSHSRRHRHHLSEAARSKTALQPHILPWLIF